MATSNIFANVRIKDPKKVEQFIDALESSERAVRNRPAAKNSGISVLRDADSIRRLIEKRKIAKSTTHPLKGVGS